MINCLLVEYGKAYKWKRTNCLQVLGFFNFMYLWIVYHWKSNISALKLSFSSFIHWSPYGNYFELFYLPNDCDFLFGLWNWRKFGLNNLLFVYIAFLCNVQSTSRYSWHLKLIRIAAPRPQKSEKVIQFSSMLPPPYCLEFFFCFYFLLLILYWN